MASRFADIPADNLWMTQVIGYAVLAIELHDTDAAALLLPLIEPFAAEVAFSGLTSQGPVGAYVGKLNSLLGRHEEAEDHLRAALATATAFGWTYHRATTLLALSQARYRGRGQLDPEAQSWLRRGLGSLPALRFPELDTPDRRTRGDDHSALTAHS